MNQNPYLKKKRIKLIKSSPQDAARQLIEEATALMNCKNIQDKRFALSQILCLSESTIEKDLYSE